MAKVQDEQQEANSSKANSITYHDLNCTIAKKGFVLEDIKKAYEKDFNMLKSLFVAKPSQLADELKKMEEQ